MRRRPRPTTCSHSSWLRKARRPRICVTLLASQPSLSMLTLTTQRMPSPGSPATPMVETTLRSSSAAALHCAGAVLALRGCQQLGIDAQRYVAALVVPEVRETRQAVRETPCSPPLGTFFSVAAFNDFVAGDHLVEVRGHVRVVAHQDHHRRRPLLVRCRRLHQVETLLPLASQRQQRRFRLLDRRLPVWACRRATDRRPVGSPRCCPTAGNTPDPAGPLLSMAGKRGIFVMPGLDGVHQAKVADDPRERRAFRIAAAVQIERRGRQVHADADATGGVDAVQPFDPHRRSLPFRGPLRRRDRRLSSRGRQAWCPSSFSTIKGSPSNMPPSACGQTPRRFLPQAG